MNWFQIWLYQPDVNSFKTTIRKTFLLPTETGKEKKRKTCDGLDTLIEKKRKIKLKMRGGEEIRRQVLKIKREILPRYFKG